MELVGAWRSSVPAASLYENLDGDQSRTGLSAGMTSILSMDFSVARLSSCFRFKIVSLFP
jgi:hypothetical protein